MHDPMKALKRRLCALKREYNKLLVEHSSLEYRHALLEGLSSSLWQLQACTLSSSQERPNIHGLQQEVHNSLLHNLAVECPQQQHQHQQHQHQQETHELDGGIQDSDARISPRSDPLAYFKSVVLTAPETNTDGLTISELAARYRETVLEANLQLAQHQVLGGVDGLTDVAKVLARTWTSLWRPLVSVLCHGHPEYLAEVSLYNFSELQPDPEGAVQNTQKLQLLPEMVNLSEQQRQDISVGTAVFEDLLQNILDQQRQLQQASCSSTVSIVGSSSTALLSDLAAIIEACQQANSRMQQILQMEYVMRTAGAAFVLGCLSWEQYTRASAASWPFPLVIPMLAKEITRCYQEQQK